MCSSDCIQKGELFVKVLLHRFSQNLHNSHGRNLKLCLDPVWLQQTTQHDLQFSSLQSGLIWSVVEFLCCSDDLPEYEDLLGWGSLWDRDAGAYRALLINHSGWLWPVNDEALQVFHTLLSQSAHWKIRCSVAGAKSQHRTASYAPAVCTLN